MSEPLNTPESFGDDGISCPVGTAAQLKLVNQKPTLAECTPEQSDHRCPNAVSFGNGSYCFTHLLRALTIQKRDCRSIK
jgi:hypothetical protein